MGHSHLYCTAGTWPRLQVENVKPHWLMVDFDHFVDQDSEEEDGKGDARQSDGLLEEQRQVGN